MHCLAVEVGRERDVIVQLGLGGETRDGSVMSPENLKVGIVAEGLPDGNPAEVEVDHELDLGENTLDALLVLFMVIDIGVVRARVVVVCVMHFEAVFVQGGRRLGVEEVFEDGIDVGRVAEVDDGHALGGGELESVGDDDEGGFDGGLEGGEHLLETRVPNGEGVLAQGRRGGGGSGSRRQPRARAAS